MVAKKTIERVIRAVTDERFPKGSIVGLSIARDFDFEGDPLLVVHLIVDKEGQLDARETAGITRHVRSKLAEIGEDAFPLVSFISRAEAEDLTPEAA